MNSSSKTSRRWIISLIAIGLAVNLFAAFWIQVPGYMDAEYYFATAQRLVDGNGFTEPFLWNYLDDPEGLPHSSHLYWMPLATVVSAVTMTVFGTEFRAAQIPFFVFATLIPALTALIGLYLHGDRRWAWRAGLFATFPGFFLPFFFTTDTFVLFAIIGCSALWLMAEASQRPSALRWLGVGVLIGLGHLTRTDGVLLLAPATLAIWWLKDGRWRSFGVLILGYLIIVMPWWARNIFVIGSAFSPGTGRVLWLLSYDELFSYPAEILTPDRWLNSGIVAIVGARIAAIWTNMQRLIGENGVFFLAPFMILGARKFWAQRLVRLATAYMGVLFIVMSIVFPFAGSRGGFFHSGTALMPILWALAPIGLDDAILWGARLRGWDKQDALKVFGLSAVVIAGILTLGLFWGKVVGPMPEIPRWNINLLTYDEVGDQLYTLDASPGTVAVNDPPGFHIATGLDAVVIPNGPPDTLAEVVERYHVSWVVLDVNRPEGLAGLYEVPTSIQWLELATYLNDPNGQPIFLFEVIREDAQP
jgi:4-amino-4-deoxy-L-arabinose transferase-like glycosyltransferase